MSLRLGIRPALLWSAPALAALVASIACGSSGNVVNPGDDSGSTSSSGGSSGTSSGGSSGTSSGGSSGTSSGGSSSGTSSGGSSSGASTSSSGSSGGGEGGSCPTETDAYVGVKLTFQVVWGMGGASGTSAASNAGGPAPVTIWLLSHDMGGATFTGSTIPCGTVLPDLELNAAGDLAVGGVPLGGKGLVNPAIPNALFDVTGGLRTYTFTGGMQGFNSGDMLSVPSVVGLLGLKATSSFDMPATMWPAYCATNQTCNAPACTSTGCGTGMIGGFNATDFSDDDKDGHPGITATPLMGPSGSCTGNCSYYFPPTAVGIGGSAPAADKVYIVSRNQFSLHGTRGSDCNKGTGKAHVTLFDNHVIGCHVSGASDCTSAQAQFIDQNRPIYADAMNNAFSSSSPADNGDVTVIQFPQGSTPTCAMVRSMLP